MKAILVLKEMPKECDECPFYDGAWGVYCMATNEPVKAEEKPSWCPLKEMPQKKEPIEEWWMKDKDISYRVGWNACLEELEK